MAKALEKIRRCGSWSGLGSNLLFEKTTFSKGVSKPACLIEKTYKIEESNSETVMVRWDLSSLTGP